MVREDIVGRCAGFILLCCAGERWAKNGVVTIIIQIKRKRPQLRRKLQCNPGCISANKTKGTSICTPASPFESPLKGRSAPKIKKTCAESISER